MEESCYMTRTLPSRIRLPAGTASTTTTADTHLGGNLTLPAPWSAATSSYQKHVQLAASQQQQQQQQYSHHVHHHHLSPSSKSYRGGGGMNGVINSTPQKINDMHHNPPPRPFSQTIPSHNKYHFTGATQQVP